jgi:hypothetical protein
MCTGNVVFVRGTVHFIWPGPAEHQPVTQTSHLPKCVQECRLCTWKGVCSNMVHCPYLTHNTHYLHQDKSKICIPKLVDSRAKVFYDISLVSIGSHEKTCALVQLIFFLTYEFVINLRTDLMFSFFFDLLTVKWSWLYILKNFTSAFLDTKQGFCL